MPTTELFSEIEVRPADAGKCGLSQEEYAQICKLLNRNPTLTELGIYGALWSEHCSYKNSIRLLKTLPTHSKYSLTQAGEENAGALDIGEGLAVVFKIESHNHPTAIEPYQGAATGVGGIMRDIFTMGARPLCSLNSLRFGPPDKDHNRYLLSRAVKGIGDYGNSLGVPVMGGELFFDPGFSRNCLVNAMVVGIARHSELTFARAEGAGNPVFIVGAATGRDGIDGASFASQDLSKQSEARRSAVQVGDPFLEKLLMEATLELLKTDAVAGIQDMGAAGLSCASAEMSAKGKVGMELDLDRVPLRAANMSAYEIMLSESQERMLVVAHSGQEELVKKIFARWELLAVEIGQVRKDGLLRISRKSRVCVEIPARSLVLGGGAPCYERKSKKPAYLAEKQILDMGTIPQTDRLDQAFLDLLGSPNVCSRRPIYEQYDSEVGLARVSGPGGNGGVARIPGSRRGLAVATDCNSRYVHLEPYSGTLSAVFESARNVATSGARPVGITNCLNFANPYVPENYYMFTESIRGMRAACQALQIPVTGGNVSFYNESEAGPILPTPTIGMVGLIDDLDCIVFPHFQRPEQTIYLAGNFKPTFGGSEYLYHRYKMISGLPPSLDLKAEVNLVNFLTEAARQKLLSSAHDLSLGGLALALFRSAYEPGRRRALGFRLSLLDEQIPGARGLRKDLLFFGETNGCALLSARSEKETLIEDMAREKGLALFAIGNTSAASQFDFGCFQADIGKAIKCYESGLTGVF